MASQMRVAMQSRRQALDNHAVVRTVSIQLDTIRSQRVQIGRTDLGVPPADVVPAEIVTSCSGQAQGRRTRLTAVHVLVLAVSRSHKRALKQRYTRQPVAQTTKLAERAGSKNQPRRRMNKAEYS